MDPRYKGRPRLTEGKKTKKIDVRFSEHEYKLIEEMERTLGISKTELIRNRLLAKAQVTVINAKELIKQLDMIGAELGRSGNNINQLARYANILINKEALSPLVIERFHLLMTDYMEIHRQLEIALRSVLRQTAK